MPPTPRSGLSPSTLVCARIFSGLRVKWLRAYAGCGKSRAASLFPSVMPLSHAGAAAIPFFRVFARPAVGPVYQLARLARFYEAV